MFICSSNRLIKLFILTMGFRPLTHKLVLCKGREINDFYKTMNNYFGVMRRKIASGKRRNGRIASHILAKNMWSAEQSIMP